MKIKFFTALISFLFLTSYHEAHRHHTLCFPENDMSFPDNGRTAGGLTKAEFDLVLDEFEAVMQFVVSRADGGSILVVERLWNNNSVNAYAVPYGIYKQVTFFGGLARHPEMTTDSLRLIACHELGHHLAGRPYWPERDPRNPNILIEGTEGWAASEGESDYYASLKCMRHLIIEGEKSNLAMKTSDLSRYPTSEVSFARNKCSQSFTNAQDRDICVRASMAGYSLGRVFKGFSSTEVSLTTPNPNVVAKTDPRHPQGQCRTDTYFQGALCEVSYRLDVLKEDPNYNTCNRRNGDTVGVRPLCWYKPS